MSRKQKAISETLGAIFDKNPNSPLEVCVLNEWARQPDISERAAAELAALRERLERIEQIMPAVRDVLQMYGNEENWKSVNGVMVLQTLSHPWGDAKEVLRHLGEVTK